MNAPTLSTPRSALKKRSDQAQLRTSKIASNKVQLLKMPRFSVTLERMDQLSGADQPRLL